MIHTMEQGSDEWKKIRLGKVTASRVIDIMPGAKNTYKASRKNYIAELICEIMTGEQASGFLGGPMLWGTETEPLGRAAYEAITGNIVREIGFIDHETIKNFGASPDGLISDSTLPIAYPGGLEIKCPNTATHFNTLLHEKIEPKYLIQMEACMMCAGVEWWDFVSYDPRPAEEYTFFVKRVTANPGVQKEIEYEINLFNRELAATLKALKDKFGKGDK